MMCLLLILILFPNITAHNDLLSLGGVCRNCSIIFFRFRGRYLSRRIAYPSNGSFNPFIISNKEAHIVNGNINAKATKVLEEKHNAICDSTDSICTYMYEGSNVRDHFRNYCLTNVGKFSCAVDCFLELCFFVFHYHLQNITCNDFFQVIYDSCNQRENLGAVEFVREPVWSLIRDRCASFSAMTANAVFSDIFTMQTFGDLTNDLKSLFLIEQCNQTCCTLCNNQIVKTTGTIVLYITCPNILPSEFKKCVSEAALPNSRPLFCDSCERHSGDISALQHFVTMPKFLTIELLSTSFGQTVLPASMEVLSNFYLLKAVVRCSSHHFTIAINSGSYWLYYDDMCTAVQQYATFQNVLDAHANGWFFAVYETLLMPSVDDNIHLRNNSSTLMPEYSFSKLEDKECLASYDFKKEVHIPRKRQRLEISTNRLTVGKRNLNFNVANSYMKNYKTAKKAKETESEKRSRQEKEKQYMRRYRRRIKDNETEEGGMCEVCHETWPLSSNGIRKSHICSRCSHDKNARKVNFNVVNAYMKNYKTARKAKETESERLCRQEKEKHYMRRYRRAIKDNEAEGEKLDKPLHNVHKETYLSQFDNKKSGPIHVQKWAIKNMQDFHNSLKFKIFMCELCHEAWPLSSKGKKKSPYICSRCSRDKNGVKKFSSQNGMTPSQVPNELQGLTQLEEMLIARVFPVISVYTKPGGQKAYKGHCINFSQDIQELANSLPTYPSELPVIVVSVKGKDNTYKDLTVRREKVSCALHWLVQHNPVYKDITIDYELLALLPSDGIPTELHKIYCTENSKDDAIDPDRGPLDEIPFNEDTELSSTILNPVQLKPQKQLITDELLQKHKVNWPHRNSSPVNEFKIEYLATMAFPTLFPDGKGDPTNSATMRDVTLGDKIKHLIKFAEYNNRKWTYRFASHPRFAYWAFNMIQRHRLLSQGNIFLKQNPGDAKLTVEQLQQMLRSNTYSTLMSKLMHYAKNVTGSNSYWHKAKEDLRATIAQVGPPTIFFTLSCAEYHWPEFHKLFCDPHSEHIQPAIRQQNVLENPHILDWFFTERTDRFVKFWLKESLGASWHWYRYEYAVQRGSIHCHGVAKLKNDPGLCELTEIALQGFLASKNINENKGNLSEEEMLELESKKSQGIQAESVVCQYVDFILTTWNPCSPEDGWSKPDSHPCQTPYLSLNDKQKEEDYVNLLNSVERHTMCSTKYCLRESNKNELSCRFKFPFENCAKTRIDFEAINTKSGQTNYRATIVTKRNDSRLNRHQPLQLQGWRANCDIQIILDYQACLEYLVKYTSKGEKASSVLNNAFTNVISKISDTSDIHNILKQIMIKSVGQRDYSIQEVMHHLLSLKCVSATHEVITASLDGSRRVQVSRNKDFCTIPSMLDVYAEREKFIKTFPDILEYNFLQFTSTFVSKSSKLAKRKRPVIVKTYPKFSSNPRNQHYGLFCKYQLLKYKPWQHVQDNAWDNLEQCDETYKACWMNFLCSVHGKNSVPDWELKLSALKASINLENENEDTEIIEEEKEEWMLMSELNLQELGTGTEYNSVLAPEGYWHNVSDLFEDVDLLSVTSWLNTQKNKNEPSWQMSSRVIDISSFSSDQLLAYHIILKHFNSSNELPLHLLIKGIAGSGKSYVIDAVRNVLKEKCQVLAYTGKASFNVSGITLHSFLKLPIGSKRLFELKGIALQQLQSNLQNIQYLIIDEYSFVGQSLFGWIDCRCRQATGLADQAFGGISVILVGDIAQLSPVGDKALFHSLPKSDKQIQGHLIYKEFKQVVTLSVNHRVDGKSNDQACFRDLLNRARNGESTIADWQTLLSRTPENVTNIDEFLASSVKLSYLKSKVAEMNLIKLKNLNQPIATIKARHSGGAQTLSSDEMGGLEPVIYLAKGARVMLTMNIWTKVGLCNGALGTVLDFVYANGQTPPVLPICVLVQFDEDYTGPSLTARFPRCVPICPITQISQNVGQKCERQQLPLKLAWAMTIHKSQGLTLKKAWVDLGPSENSPGMTYVALSRVKKLQDLIIEPMTFERLQAYKKSTFLQYRLLEENRLDSLSKITSKMEMLNEFDYMH